MSNVGFIGVGYMGYGMAKNLLKKHNLYIFAHKNRKPINKLSKIGAKELKTYSEIKDNKIDCLMICVTNTPIAINVANKIQNYLNSKTLVIDLTTHDKNGALKMSKIFQSKKISYNFCGVMGGPVQSEQGILGGIYGGKKNDFLKCKKYLNTFCKSVFNFGDVSKASSAKLLSNFLSLMTTTSVIEFFKSAKKLDINIKLLCDVARLGSGNSGALDRIANKAIKGNYKGYVFSVDNTYKDLNYINDLVSDLPNANKLSKLAKSFYKEASKKGFGNFLVSELIDKEKY
tara:strand:- start:1823 stop:2683 length:861 start_codon:yes stop_codon:yes gene_type:complete